MPAKKRREAEGGMPLPTWADQRHRRARRVEAEDADSERDESLPPWAVQDSGGAAGGAASASASADEGLADAGRVSEDDVDSDAVASDSVSFFARGSEPTASDGEDSAPEWAD